MVRREVSKDPKKLGKLGVRDLISYVKLNPSTIYVYIYLKWVYSSDYNRG